MSYPILAPSRTWFAPNDSAITRSIITEIEIMDSYTPNGTEIDSWDASEAKDGSITCYVIGTKLIMAGDGSGKISANEDSSYWFEYNNDDFSDYDVPQNVERIIGLSILDTSNVRDFSYMFYYFIKITELDLSTFNTSSATTLESMFSVCFKLSSLNISNWDTSKVTTIAGIFNNCNSLEYVEGLDEIDTSNVTSMRHTFSYSKVTNFTNLNTSKVTNMEYTFIGYLRDELVFPNWDLSSVTSFYACFVGGPEGGTIKTLDLSNFKHSEKASLSGLFLELSSLTKLTMPREFGKGVKDFSYTFRGLSNVKNINLENIDLSSATNLDSMFSGCSSLTGLDVSKWDVSNVTDMSFMFYGCSKLGSIDVSKWDTSKVTTLDHFAAHANLKRIGMEKWNTSSLVNANAAFHNCGEEELDLSAWDVSNVQFFSQMFENSTKLKRIHGLDKWDTSNALVFDEMFGRCSKLEELDLSSWDTRKARKGVQSSTNGHTGSVFNNMFQSCNNLRKVKVGANFSINGDGTNTTASYKFILPTPSSDYIEGADGYWYTFNGEKYAPNGIKDKTEETYYASYNMITDLDAIVKNGSLLDAANAIRHLTGSSERYKPSEFKKALDVEVNVIPDEVFHITGLCSYRFAYGSLDWFLNKYADKITTSDITDANRMFYSCKAERVPSEINFVEGGCPVPAMFGSCSNLKYIPSIDFKHTSAEEAQSMFSFDYALKEIGKLSNLFPLSPYAMFRNCNNLRYLPEFENLNLSYAQTNSTTYGYQYMFGYCSSLREISKDFLEQLYCDTLTNVASTIFYYGFTACYVLDEIIGMNPQTGTLVSNTFVNTFNLCSRAKDIIFATQEDSTPYLVNWKNQTIDLSKEVGYTTNGNYVINSNSGINSDKRATNDTTYQALKSDKDWYTTDINYSRYNHDSAVNTINSLPDTSAYLTANGGTNTIKFKGESGALTDGGAINTLTEEEIAVATAKGWTVTFA